jgi:hypothetical protein
LYAPAGLIGFPPERVRRPRGLAVEEDGEAGAATTRIVEKPFGREMTLHFGSSWPRAGR